MKTLKEFMSEATQTGKPTHTVHMQKIQYGYWGETPYNDKVKKLKVHAEDEADAEHQARWHPDTQKAAKRLRNGDSVRYKILKVEKH